MKPADRIYLYNLSFEDEFTEADVARLQRIAASLAVNVE